MPEKYNERIVAFVDILGFSALINSVKPGASADDLINEIEAVLSADVAAHWTERDQSSARMFSDCICFSSPPTIGGFLLTIAKLMIAQTGLLKRGLLTRGAITTGRHYESDRMIFSEGLVRAYKLEQTVACHPRIILDAHMVQQFYDPIRDGDRRRILANPFLLRDADGQVFLNYLSMVSGPDIGSRRERHLEMQKELVMKGRAEHSANPAIMSKLAWVTRFHNFIVRRLHASRPDLIIGDPDSQGFELVMPT